MSFKTKIFTAGLAMALFATVGFAQQQQNQTSGQSPEVKEGQRPPGREQARGFRRERGPRGLFDPRLMHELNLTDDQRQQIGQIVANNFENTKEQRELLGQLIEKKRQGTLTDEEQARLKSLHEQMRLSMQITESRIAALLTADQKAKLEQIIKERRENRERFGGRRRGGFGAPNQSNPQPQKPGTTPNG